jgi:hypothetical protein
MTRCYAIVTELFTAGPAHALTLLVFLVAACAPTGHSTGAGEIPVRIDLVRGVRWDYPNEGFDPNLPGFHLAGGIGTVRLTGSAAPEAIVLKIRTTTAQPPNLEGFTVQWAETLLQMAPFGEGSLAELITDSGDGSRGRQRQMVHQWYFEFSREEDIVRVRFLPPALRLIPRGCTVSWVDWYRR